MTIYRYDSHKESNFIIDITEDKDGNLWVVITEGLNFYNRERDSFILLLIEGEAPYMSDILEGPNGLISVATRARPKDIIRVDFYLANTVQENIIVAAVGCTVHSVSGALTSIKDYHLLRQRFFKDHLNKASDISNRLNSEFSLKSIDRVMIFTA